MKKILLITLVVILTVFLTWFFGGLMVWFSQNQDFFKSFGPWGDFGGFLLFFVSLVIAFGSVFGGIVLSVFIGSGEIGG